MVTLSAKEVERLLVVVSEKQRERMGTLLGVGADAFFVCGSVFEAVAEAALGREGGRVVVVTVDTLDAEEMGVFSTLAKMEGVATIGVTSLPEPNRKLQEALNLGADGGCSLADDSERLGDLVRRVGRAQPGTPIKTSDVVEIVEEPKHLVSETEQHRSQAEEAAAAEPSDRMVKDQGGRNRLKEISPLSDEELTALLG